MVAIGTDQHEQPDVTYQYDSDGVRVSESTHDGAAGTTTTTRYVNDKQNPTGYAKAVEEHTQTTGQAEETRSYVFGLQVIGQSDASGVHYLLLDGHGSTRALSDAVTGEISTMAGVKQAYTYDAYGKLLNMAASQARTSWLFGGDGIYDINSGWTYHLARWRDGFRFTSFDSFEADPGSPANLHKYLYADANPIIAADPTGRFGLPDVLVTTGISAAIGAFFGGAILVAGGNARQAIKHFALGTETGVILCLSLADGQIGELVGAGILGGLSNFVLSSGGDLLRNAEGKPPIGGAPSKAKYLDAFLTGFEIGVNQEFATGGSGIVGAALKGALIAGASDIASAYLSGEPIDWKAVTTDTLGGAVVSMILNTQTADAFISPEAEPLAEEVAKQFASLGAACALGEVQLLVQTWLP